MAASSRTKTEAPLNEDALTFALDIGTRSVVGVVGKQESDGFHILDYEQLEHLGRAMTDGQVEDIKAVASIIAKVKSALEQRLNIELHGAAVAAAGRTLKTVRTKLERDLKSDAAIDREFVLGMESEAIEQAQQSIQNNDAPASMRFYFVGYSIVQYSMDGLSVSSLVGHTCSHASVELIAAFLPFSVIESLYAAVESCGLNVVSLTLEPIAAMNVLIPPELRLLNLALVDIGAGTSDVAVCRDGAVCAYEMATVAGDEITEAIIKNCLVNFETAEALKRQLGSEENTLEFEDVLYMQRQISRRELLEAIEPAVDSLAKTIADKILSCNGDVPAAVFVIGGGSQIPGLGERLSAYLHLDSSKISAGRSRPLRGVSSDFPELSSPEFVTPIGIGLTAVTQQSFQFWGVSVNGKPLKLLIRRDMRMIDLLLMAGYQTANILGRAGRSLLYYIDGEQQLIKGGLPEHAKLGCNESEASVDTLVYPGDRISFSPAVNGEDAELRLGELISEEPLGMVNICSHDHRIGIWAEINGEYAPPETIIQPQDRITTHSVHSLGDLCRDCKLSIDPAQLLCEGEYLSSDLLLVDGMRISLTPEAEPLEQENLLFAAETANEQSEEKLPYEKPSQSEAFIEEEIHYEVPAEEASVPSSREEAAEAPAITPDAGENAVQADEEKSAPAFDFGAYDDELYGEDEEDENQEEAAWPDLSVMPAPAAKKPDGLLSLTLNGKPIELPLSAEHPHYYVMNLLGRCGLDLKNPKGNIMMRVNGANAAFSNVLNSGDVVEIGWL